MKRIITFILIILFLFIVISLFSNIKASAEQLITVTEYPKDNKYFDGGYILVDIQLDDIKNLCSYIGQGTFSELVREAGNPIIAINGDYWNYQINQRYIIRNGEVLNEPLFNSSRDYCVINKFGEMNTYHHTTITDISQLKNSAWQIFSFGPQLVHNYQPIENYQDCFDHDLAWNSHPRTAIGYYEKNHFCFLIVMGRNEIDHGCYLEDMANFFADLECKEAYNLDGGSSVHIWYDGEEIGKPDDNKPLTDIIYIRN